MRRALPVLVVVIILLAGNFFGLTRIAGYEWYVDCNTARTKRVDYILFIPVSSATHENILSKSIYSNKIPAEHWVLSVSRPITRRVNNTKYSGKLLASVNMMNFYIEVNHNVPDEVLINFFALLKIPNTGELFDYVNSVSRPSRQAEGVE